MIWLTTMKINKGFHDERERETARGLSPLLSFMLSSLIMWKESHTALSKLAKIDIYIETV